MRKDSTDHKLPANGPAREALRETGQFWTPEWIARAMVRYVMTEGTSALFDPAVGEGAFFRAAKSLQASQGAKTLLLGTEIDARPLQRAIQTGLSESDLKHVEVRDFVLSPPEGPFEAIVANPPYLRHHRVPAPVKERLRVLSKQLIGRTLDGRAGYHVYFLLRALELLAKDGRLAFIMPSDTCEGVFAKTLWSWIVRNFRLEAVVTFASEASPFPGVDTNAVIFMIRNSSPTDSIWWASCRKAETGALESWVASGFGETDNELLLTMKRAAPEALQTGLSRPPMKRQRTAATLADFAYVMRGIASGANEFFFLTRAKARSLGLPEKYLVPALGRTRDVRGDEITKEDIEKLEAAGRPTLLLSLDGRQPERLPQQLQEYLSFGEKMGVDSRTLVSTRRPWYKMETREVPPFLFAYLGRRNARFIRNRAAVVPLTCLLCVYPRNSDPGFVEKLWAVLCHQDTLQNLKFVGKSYGHGAIKVEPRALERLVIPQSALLSAGLISPRRSEQLGLWTSIA